MVKVTATFKLMQILKISLEFQIKSMYFKDDRGSFDSHAKSTYYARTGLGVYGFSDKTCAQKVSAAKCTIDSVYQYLF